MMRRQKPERTMAKKLRPVPAAIARNHLDIWHAYDKLGGAGEAFLLAAEALGYAGILLSGSRVRAPRPRPVPADHLTTWRGLPPT